MISNNDLMKALYSGDLEAIKTSLKNGSDVNKPYNANGYTPFMFACREFYEPEVIELFLSHGGDVMFCNFPRMSAVLMNKRTKMERLFDMRLDGELDRESFDQKRNDLQLKISRLKNKVLAHEKADSHFDETILGLLDIATQSGYIFEKSSNVDLKRLLLKFVFENITLTEGEISYKLRFPFNEFVNTTNPDDNNPLPYELSESLSNKGVEANDNEKVQSGYKQSCEPQKIYKKQEVALKNATSLQSGWRDEGEIQRKTAQIYNILVSHRSEILQIKEQAQLVRRVLVG